MDTSLWRVIEFALVPLQMAGTERYARLWTQFTAIAAVADALVSGDLGVPIAT
jgi:hypothetical protein